MPVFKEIEDVEELERLSHDLSSRIFRRASYEKIRIIGYPSNHIERKVKFKSRNGSNVLWWTSWQADNDEAMINLIGRGDPNGRETLLIELQFNIPIRQFSRKHGGAFVRELETNSVFLAHRGIVTRGKARIAKNKLLAETSATTSSVMSSNGSHELFLVASLASDTLLDDIAAFSQEIRRAADVVASRGDAGTLDDKKQSNPNELMMDAGLSNYFDEFGGKRRLPARKSMVVLVRHGGVVKQLSDEMEKLGDVKKSKLMDLVIIAKEMIYLFEVKTGLDTTALYLAIGQLSLHALALANLFPKRMIRKVMVIPGAPSDDIKNRLSNDLGIKVLGYEWNGVAPVIFNRDDLDSIFN